jgi:hypothetical protein
MWDKAEAALTDALNASGREWTLNPEDGAFYGPKIDITGARGLGAGGMPAGACARAGRSALAACRWHSNARCALLLLRRGAQLRRCRLAIIAVCVPCAACRSKTHTHGPVHRPPTPMRAHTHTHTHSV